ncbi:MAG: non-homologous end-joining DNA ligase [Bacteroidales bacterium]
MREIKKNGRTVEITNPDKEIFPDAGLSKKDLVNFYERMAEYILPYLKNRPLVMHRYPNGISGKDFYQKDQPDYFPEWIKTVKVKLREEGSRHMVLCNDEATLLYLANQASITPHVWLSTIKNLENPDRLIFDLDPPKGNFELVQDGAGDLKKIFDKLDMEAFVMTTGSKGMHVVVPLDGKTDFEESRSFAKKIAAKLADDMPDKYTTEVRTGNRRGRLFLDYMRNAYGQTGVAPYAIRARKGAPVATPLDWSEAVKKDMNAQKYNYKNIFSRLSAKDDPWKNINRHNYSLKTAGKIFDKTFL